MSENMNKRSLKASEKMQINGEKDTHQDSSVNLINKNAGSK